MSFYCNSFGCKVINGYGFYNLSGYNFYLLVFGGFRGEHFKIVMKLIIIGLIGVIGQFLL